MTERPRRLLKQGRGRVSCGGDVDLWLGDVEAHAVLGEDGFDLARAGLHARLLVLGDESAGVVERVSLRRW